MERRFFRNLSSYDNPVFNRLAKVFSLLLLNLLWLAGSLPLVTLGPALCAMYYTVAKHIKRERDSLFGCFLSSYRENFGCGCVLTLLLALIAGFLFLDYHCYSLLGEGTVLSYLYLTLVTGLAAVTALTLPYVFPVLSRYRVGVAGCLRLSLLLMLKYLPVSILMAVLNAAAVLAILAIPELALFLPAPVCFLCSLLLEPVLKKHLPDVEGDPERREWYEE